jgi:tight adherence protein C
MAGIVLFYIIINSSVKQRYCEELEPLDDRQYACKGLLPFGLWVFDEIHIPSAGAYVIYLYQRVVMVYGTRYARYYLKVHWAEKFMNLFLGMTVASFLGAVSNSGLGFLPVIPISGALLFFLTDKNLDDKAQKRKLQLMMDFPVFISKLTLLMNAGMHLRQALERIYADAMKKTPLYAELGTVLEDIAAGVRESQAWQEFSERCKVKEITSFSSMISQNTKIGGNKMIDEMKRMTHEAWEMRKHAAKQLGETAASRLIFPLMLMFLAILATVITPAIMQFSTGF